MKVKYPPPVSKNWGFMEWADIPDRADPELVYLRRFRVFQTPYVALYVHWIMTPDTDRDPHDHPWNFFSFILRGGYTERLWETTTWPAGRTESQRISYIRRWNRFTLHRMPRHLAHKIISADTGLVTVILTGRRQGSWGFWTPGGFIDQKPYRAAERSISPNEFA
jgi:hypothetical protein